MEGQGEKWNGHVRVTERDAGGARARKQGKANSVLDGRSLDDDHPPPPFWIDGKHDDDIARAYAHAPPWVCGV